MARRLSDLPESLRGAILRAHPELEPGAAPAVGRFGNRRCVGRNGEGFDSEHERRVIEGLEDDGYTVIRQVSMPVARGVRIRVDGLVITERFPDGSFRGKFVDPKGFLTDAARVKLLAFETRYNVGVELVRKKDEVGRMKGEGKRLAHGRRGRARKGTGR